MKLAPSSPLASVSACVSTESLETSSLEHLRVEHWNPSAHLKLASKQARDVRSGRPLRGLLPRPTGSFDKLPFVLTRLDHAESP